MGSLLRPPTPRAEAVEAFLTLIAVVKGLNAAVHVMIGRRKLFCGCVKSRCVHRPPSLQTCTGRFPQLPQLVGLVTAVPRSNTDSATSDTVSSAVNSPKCLQTSYAIHAPRRFSAAAILIQNVRSYVNVTSPRRYMTSQVVPRIRVFHPLRGRIADRSPVRRAGTSS